MGGIWFKSEPDLHNSHPKITDKKFNEEDKMRFSEATLNDRNKVQVFKSKTVKISKNKTKFTGDDRLEIIQNAIEDLELTEEPIKKFYTIDKVLGAGKFGVVKLGFSKCKFHHIFSNFEFLYDTNILANPNFKVAVKIITLK